MDYITPAEAAGKWGVSVRRVQLWCAENRIPGTIHVGHQWLVPIEAERPADGRTKNAKASVDYVPYHFPVFIFTEYYSHPDLLSEDEQTLLNAQILSIQNQFLKSFDICKRLITSSHNSAVRFGACLTNAHNSMLLGVAEEFRSCLELMEKIRDGNPVHGEDYSFLIEYIRYQYQFNCKPLLSIDLEKLSSEARPVYVLEMLSLSYWESETETIMSLKSFKLLCKQFEALGILPGAMVANAYLAYQCNKAGLTEDKLWHIEKVCKFGREKGFLTMLSKFSNTFYDDYRSCLRKHSADFAEKLADVRCNNLRNVAMFYSRMKGIPILFSHTSDEIEIMLLLSNNVSIKSISRIKGISQKSVNEIIVKLCGQYNFTDKSQLVEFSVHFFSEYDEKIFNQRNNQ